ncbi:hypothetical protein LTR56_001575 [Elasticomyces elasticus]|nr:hypothetical protein LTR56_001575 [Elasticomyces elasticus]
MADQEKESISALSLEIIELFKKVEVPTTDSLNVGQENFTAKLYDESERFMLWTGNLGALHSSVDPRSLAYRVRNAPEVHRRTTDLLQELEDLLGEGVKLYTSGSNVQSQKPAARDLLDDEALISELSDLATSHECKDSWLIASISDTIARLFKISSLLSRFTSTDRFAKAESARLPELDVRYDVAHMHGKFAACQTEHWLLDRLGTANTKRRQTIIYCREHRERLAELPNIRKETTTILPFPDKVSTVQTYHELAPKTQSSRPSVMVTTASTLKPIHTIPIDDGFDDSRSFSTMATSLTASSSRHRLKIPALADVGKVSEPFECPYCYTMQRFNGPLSWRKHVFADLRPYICTFRECGMLLFDSKSAWTSHEMKEHRRYWICGVCNDYQSNAQDEFAAHLKLEHADTLANAELESLLGACSRPLVQYPARVCLFCNWEEILRTTNGHIPAHELITVTTTQYMKHLASHLEQIALFALPRPSSGDDMEESIDVAPGASAGSCRIESSSVASEHSVVTALSEVIIP